MSCSDKPRVCDVGGCSVKVTPRTRKVFDHLGVKHDYAVGCVLDLDPRGTGTMAWAEGIRIEVDPVRSLVVISALVLGRTEAVEITIGRKGARTFQRGRR